MSLTVKAYFYEDFSRDSPVPSEIRRFSIDTDVSSSYTYLTQKLASVLAARGVQANSLATYWRDVDGDFVTFSSDEELVEALGSINGDMFKLHVHRVEPKGSDVSQPCEAQRQQWGWWRPPQQIWGGFHGFGHGGPMWQGCHQPRWGRCISRREERRQQRRQDLEQKGATQRDQVAAEENETQQRQKFEHQRKGRRQQLRKLGKAVAAALGPFGVEVDVDVTDDTCARQKEEQCCESDSDQEPTVPSKESVETSQEESDAAFAVAAQAQEFHDAATEAVAAVTGVAPSYPYEQALHQLKEMGFDDDEGWLTHLLHAKGGDIGRVLDAIQPQSKKM